MEMTVGVIFKYTFFEKLHHLSLKIVLFLFQICNRIYGFVGESNGTSSVNTESRWSKQEACFARETQVHVRLAVNHSTSVTYGELIKFLGANCMGK